MPCKVNFLSLESALFKPSLIRTNVMESGSVHILAVTRKGLGRDKEYEHEFLHDSEGQVLILVPGR